MRETFSIHPGSSNRTDNALKMRTFLTILLCCTFLLAFADKTTRKRLRPEVQTETTVETDSVTVISNLPDSAIVLTGYDKPLYSQRETVFVINKSGFDFDEMNVTITYYDLQNRQLHTRDVSIKKHIPAGETLQVYFKSWDVQNSFYYAKSRKPRTQATPYTVKCKVNNVSIYCR